MVTATSLVSIRSTRDFVSCCNITQAGSQSITAHSTPALPLLPVFLLLALGKRYPGEELSMDSHLKDFLGLKKSFLVCFLTDQNKLWFQHPCYKISTVLPAKGHIAILVERTVWESGRTKTSLKKSFLVM